MKLKVLAVGKIKERPVRDLIALYAGRIAHYASYAEVEVEDDEGAFAQALSKHRVGAKVVALDSRGQGMTSHAFSALLGRLSSTGKGDVLFLIGGKAGLSEASMASSDHVVSFSLMTFPHRLARLLLAEQLYRGLTILRGEPYGL